jgi:hypothetical protein
LNQLVLKNPGYRNRARYFKKVIAKTRGLDVAAGVIERAFAKDQTAGVAGERTVLSHV